MRRFGSDERGATAAEFAVVAPILIALVMGSIEFGSIMYTLGTTEFATNDAARQLATNRITASQVAGIIALRLPSWAQASAAVTISQSSTDPNKNQYTVTTNVPLSSATPTQFFSLIYGTKSFNCTAVMQQEPTS
ncbi:TadE family protein [Methylobacterium sp. 4-46]|uniref:TadE/TadG family type IV pilus assembly protein n=1 Tax=unclassified Methylobacterium TaxID=2615210 RepID=UPI000165CAEF|nr:MULTISPECIES: TadE/TadG family type IV pilus assembly protein [Methylobacterium]ACA20188.1 TadE family protein [Methylobacterium sp. 4-46]WFT79368.1 TadE/TadG family type IV pilus assembly protein [Methylobacterium nodulans]